MSAHGAPDDVKFIVGRLPLQTLAKELARPNIVQHRQAVGRRRVSATGHEDSRSRPAHFGEHVSGKRFRRIVQDDKCPPLSQEGADVALAATAPEMHRRQQVDAFEVAAADPIGVIETVAVARETCGRGLGLPNSPYAADLDANLSVEPAVQFTVDHVVRDVERREWRREERSGMVVAYVSQDGQLLGQGVNCLVAQHEFVHD